jgi:hypothetical protein
LVRRFLKRREEEGREGEGKRRENEKTYKHQKQQQVQYGIVQNSTSSWKGKKITNIQIPKIATSTIWDGHSTLAR